MGKTVEYSPKITIPVTENLEKSEFDYKKHAESQYEEILSTSPKLVFKHFTDLVTYQNDKFVWDEEKVKRLNGILLYNVATICFNTKNPLRD